MVAIFGGRNWTIVSAGLLLIPAVLLGIVVSNPETPFGVLLLVAALGGVGGGNFASSMANITYFFPQKEKGWALGLNAAGGNLGTAVAQFAVPIVVTIGAGATFNIALAGWMWIPLDPRRDVGRLARTWTTCRRPRPTSPAPPRRCASRTCGSWRCSTSARSARSSVSRASSPS